ncbi:MAG: FG-GAP-like repeat-containing protein [Gemmataceae bacterium]
MRYWYLVLGGITLTAGVLLGLAPWEGRSPKPPPADGRDDPPAEEYSLVATPGVPWFEDVTRAAGIDFQHNGDATPRHLIQETIGSGLGWIDYNRDGWPDLFCVQVASSGSASPAKAQPTHRLFENQGDGTFRDVSAQAGVALSGYGMGVEVGDFDNDGFDDLLLSEIGRVVLLHNQAGSEGKRRFVDVTARAGLANRHWGTSCAWGDVDGDGWLDLYIANYVEIDPARPLVCRDHASQKPQSCTPTAYPHTHHRLFRNRRDGTFEDISERAGITRAPPAPGLGVVMADLDSDGLIDIYVANDMKPAYLFQNLGQGRFVEKALEAGCALGRNGNSMAGMGVALGDLDGTGRPSLFVTNFQHEPNVLFLNRGQMHFDEQSHPSGLGLPSLARLGFGTVALDADREGRLDLAVVNGHVNRHAQVISRAPFTQEGQLFLGLGGGKFREVSRQAGAYFHQRHVGRGLAVADYDRDGRPDLAVSNNGGPVLLLRNRTENTHRGLTLTLQGDGVKSNRNAIGARVEVQTTQGKQTYWIHGGGSYLSSSDRTLHVGLGSEPQTRAVRVRWPSGHFQEFGALEADQAYRLVEGKARAESVPPPPIR